MFSVLVRGLLLFTMVIALGISAPKPAEATPLNLTLLDFPDIVSGFIDVTYNATTDALVTSGFALQLDDDGVGAAEAIAGGSFDLLATIDAAGNMAAGGTLTIGGTVAALGFNSGTLLTGNLLQFGFPNAGGDPLEFIFSVTGGDAAALFGSFGGVIMSATNFPATLFTQDFNNTGGEVGAGSAVTDTAAIPEPGTLLLLLSGGAALARRRFRGARR